MICGGDDEFKPADPSGSKTCYAYSFRNDTWNLLNASLKEDIHYAGYSLLPHYGLVTTGNQPTNTVAQAYRLPQSAAATASHHFAAMTQGKNGACQVTLDDERIVTMGGAVSIHDYTKQMLELNVRTNVWKSKAEMPSERQHHGCGVIRDPEDGSPRSIVVAGGYRDGQLLKTVEIYDLATDTWRPGKEIQ